MVRDFRTDGVRLGNKGRFFVDHVSSATGSYVRNRQEFHDQLKRKSEEETITTGIEHNYLPFDGDAADVGVSEKAPELAARSAERLGRFQKKFYA